MGLKELKRREDIIDRHVLKGLNVISILLAGPSSVFVKRAVRKPKCTTLPHCQ